MAEVSETCSCGAQFKWNGNGDSHDSVLRIFESWRANHRHTPKDDGFRPSGGNTASTERKWDSTPHELDSEHRPGPYGRGISLKWHGAP